MKLPNRYGTVYKLSGKNRRNPYVAKAYLRTADSGKPIYRILGYFSTKQEALSALVACNDGRLTEDINITLTVLYNRWSSAHYKTIAPSTVRQYTAAWAQLKPLCNLPVSQIRVYHLQAIITEAAKQLKRGSLEKIKLLAVMLFDYAVKNDICQKNYATYITLPKKEKTEKSVFSQSEISLLWDNISLPCADSVLFMIYTGFRVGEMLSLRVCDVDDLCAFVKGGNKTAAGKNRLVPVHPRIRDIIKNRSENKPADAYLFDFSYSKYTSEFKKLMNLLKITNKTPHCCRHTFATNMAKSGADINALKTIMGHSSYAITADIYTHLDNTDLSKAIRVLDWNSHFRVALSGR